MQKYLSWLPEGEPWVEYRTRIDLLDENPEDRSLKYLYTRITDHPQIADLMNQLESWPGSVLKRHNDAKLLLHKLVFLADIGLKKDIPQIAKISEIILDNHSDEGPFNVMVNIPTRFGGSGKDEMSWFLCDAPLIVYSLGSFGYKEDERVLKALDYLTPLARDNGWPCAASPRWGKFRGPGRKDDPCPYATLIMLKAILPFASQIDPEIIKTGIQTFENLWQIRKEKKPFLFAMGTDFKKLKAPLIWYDILHLLDTLSSFEGAEKLKVVSELAAILKNKSDKNGMFTPESIYMPWKGWDFGQKKAPSRWITFLAHRIISRLNKYKSGE